MVKLKTGFLVVLVGMVVLGIVANGVSAYNYNANCYHTPTESNAHASVNGGTYYDHAFCKVENTGGSQWLLYAEAYTGCYGDGYCGDTSSSQNYFYSASFGTSANAYDSYLGSSQCHSCTGSSYASALGGYNENCDYHECDGICD